MKSITFLYHWGAIEVWNEWNGFCSHCTISIPLRCNWGLYSAYFSVSLCIISIPLRCNWGSIMPKYMPWTFWYFYTTEVQLRWVCWMFSSTRRPDFYTTEVQLRFTVESFFTVLVPHFYTTEVQLRFVEPVTIAELIEKFLYHWGAIEVFYTNIEVLGRKTFLYHWGAIEVSFSAPSMNSSSLISIPLRCNWGQHYGKGKNWITGISIPLRCNWGCICTTGAASTLWHFYTTEVQLRFVKWPLTFSPTVISIPLRCNWGEAFMMQT